MNSVFAWQALPRLHFKRIGAAAETGNLQRVTKVGMLVAPHAQAATVGDLADAWSVNGKDVVLPTVTVETPRGPALHRLPLSLGGWVMRALNAASEGVKLFPDTVEFSELDGRFTADFVSVNEPNSERDFVQRMLERQQMRADEPVSEVSMSPTESTVVTTFLAATEDRVTLRASKIGGVWQLAEFSITSKTQGLTAAEALVQLRQTLPSRCVLSAQTADRAVQNFLLTERFTQTGPETFEWRG